MVPSVTMVLQRFKTDWAAQLQPEAIHAACEAVGYTAWRDRLLNPVITVQLFLLQILHGNTACRHLPHLAGFYFSASAYCQARAKLPIRVLEYLLERFGQSAGCEYEWNRKLGSCIRGPTIIGTKTSATLQPLKRMLLGHREGAEAAGYPSAQTPSR
jgi:hypothetical protein